MRNKVQLPAYLVKQAKQARNLSKKPITQIKIPHFSGLIGDTIRRFDRKEFIVKNKHLTKRGLSAGILYQRQTDGALLYLFVQDFSSFTKGKPDDIQGFLRKMQSLNFSPNNFYQQTNFELHKKIVALIKENQHTSRYAQNIVGIDEKRVIYFSWI